MRGQNLYLLVMLINFHQLDLGSILKCIIASKKINVITLDQIFRQAARSKIVLNAHKVNSGQYFVEDKDNELEKDFFFVQETNQEKIVNFVLSLYRDGLKKFDNYEDFKTIQIITPSKKGICGTKELNKKIQELINPDGNNKKQKACGQVTFREGDSIMQMKNNYDIEWEQDGNLRKSEFSMEKWEP